MPVNAPPRRGRPPKINRADVVAAAIDLGLDAFSLDGLAERLGVTTPALYHHVDGRDHVLQLAATQVISDAAPQLEECADWTEWLEGWATLIRAAVGPVGEAFVETIRTQVGDESLAVAAGGLERLVAAGFSPADAGHALWLATRIACTAGPADAPAISAPLQGVEQADADPPANVRAAMDAVAADADHGFDFDLAILIDGLSARLNRR